MPKKFDHGLEVITIQGLAVPVDWDDEGRAIQVSIATFDEDEFFIDDDLVAVRLLQCIGKEVVIRGVLQTKGPKKSLEKCSILRTKESLS